MKYMHWKNFLSLLEIAWEFIFETYRPNENHCATKSFLWTGKALEMWRSSTSIEHFAASEYIGTS